MRSLIDLLTVVAIVLLILLATTDGCLITCNPAPASSAAYGINR